MKAYRSSVPSFSDLQYAAAMETLEVYRLQNPPQTECFRMPVTAVRDGAAIPSSEVRNLLASQAQPCNLEGHEWLAMQWLDFVAVGKAPRATGNALWAALITSVPDKVRKAAEDTFRIACRAPRPQSSDKLRRYLNVIGDLDSYGQAIGRLAPLASIDGANAEKSIMDACRRHFGYVSLGVGEGASACIKVLVLCAQADFESVAQFFASSSITPVPVSSLRSFFVSSLVGIRNSTGVGWFPDIDRFARVIKDAVKGKHLPSIAVGDAVNASGSGPRQSAVKAVKAPASDPQPRAVEAVKAPGSGPRQRAVKVVKAPGSGPLQRAVEAVKAPVAGSPQRPVEAVKAPVAGSPQRPVEAVKAPGSCPRQRAVEAGSMLATMGWSSGKLEDLGGQTEWSPSEKAGYRWSDGDIQVYRMPNAYLPGDEVIEANSPEDLIKDTWHTFESTFPQDRVLIAIRYKGYGSRSAKPQDDHETRNFCLLPPLHISAAGLLRRVFGKCDIQVIGYTAGESATTRSGLLERLTKRYRTNPTDAEAKAGLVDWIRRLAHPERLAEPRESILDECCRIEQGFAGAIPEGDNLRNPRSGKMQSLLELLFRRGSTGRGGFRSGCLLAGLVVREILRFKRVDILNMVKRPATSAVGRFKEIRGLNQEVQEHFAADKDVGRSHGAKFRLLALYKDLALVFANLCRGHLGLTDKLQAWVRSNFEFFCVMPMDHVAPVSPGTPTMRRSYTGRIQSCRNYPLLFSDRQEDASVPVDMGPLLAIVGQALDLGGKGRSRGWLTNKISETNEMATAMLIRTGSDVDFPLELLALDYDRTKDIGLILEQVDSRLMVRCIIESQGGDQALRTWSEGLETFVKQQCLAASPPGDSDYLENFERLDALFDFFRDHTGLAAAALDCCRESVRARPADAGCPVATPFRIYFRSDMIREVFKPRPSGISRRTLHFTGGHDARLGHAAARDDEARFKEAHAVCNKLGQMVTNKPLDMLHAIALARRLRSLDPVEARSMAEHLRNIEEHLNESRGPLSDPVCFKALRNALLRG